MTEPKYKPVRFSAPMVREILEGRKTQTRMIVKFNAAGRVQKLGKQWHIDDEDAVLACPYGVGNRLWVKESFKFNPGGPIYDASGSCMDSMDDELIYRADRPNLKTKWTPSIHMPRWASRITLEVTGVRVERLQDISESNLPMVPIYVYENVWNSIHGPGAWDKNPWVWVVEFKRVEG